MQIRQRVVTLSLMLANIFAFAWSRYAIGTFEDPTWTQGLLLNGAEFAPLTLDTQWYRLFTHLFLHGNLMHLAFNMYALFTVGSEVERITGPIKFLWVYFLCGFAASLASIVFNLFAIGVGASGAIFGLFGFSLVAQIVESRKQEKPITPLLINFIIFLGVNLLYAKALNADNAAHMGGLAGGIILGVTSLINRSYHQVKAEYLMLPLLVLLFLSLPRYPVTYFKFFQKVLSVEDSAQALFKKPNLSDEVYVKYFKQLDAAWDSTQKMLDAQPYLPEALHQDTFRLHKYIALRRLENNFRINLVEQESYRYLDSIEWSQQQMQPYYQLDYPLTQLLPIRKKEADTTAQPRLHPVKIWYNDEWEEVPGPPAAFYRIGQQDSMHLWQGWVHDYFSNGAIQMKGFYTDGRKDGAFLYYSNRNTYEQAGRYKKEIPVGKWEAFHYNGKLKSEEYFEPEYFMKNLWDSLGVFQVKEGEGLVQRYHPNGELAEQGAYRKGKKEGRWIGYHANGQMYFEEHFLNGRLMRGRSRTAEGLQVVYDETSLFPMPETGFENYTNYLRNAVRTLNPTVHGTVKIWFRVTVKQVLTDFQVDQSLTPTLDSNAIEILKAGPAWLPARDHGHRLRNGWSTVAVVF